MNKAHSKNKKLRQRYGISKSVFDLLLKGQNYKCLICEIRHVPEKPLYVDHEHKTGIVRGLICQKCNTILGFCKDSVKTLKSAIEYIESAISHKSDYDAEGKDKVSNENS